jgi:UDP-glucose:(heptosyl)LPS alpha-1,3-glucosyltransferase
LQRESRRATFGRRSEIHFMRLAFAIVSLFPWGGLQRDCMRLAKAAQDQGHEVTIFTTRRQGELPDDLHIYVLPVSSLTNSGRNYKFSQALRRVTAGRFDQIIGFDKIPGLDILYCGDVSFVESHDQFWARFVPRHRMMTNLEGSCFAPSSQTKLLLLAEPQMEGYRRFWQTPNDRIQLLPPPVDAGRRRPHLRSNGVRERIRAELGLGADELGLLCLGMWSHRKGFDRAIAALEKVPNAKLLIAGVPKDDPFTQKTLKSRKYAKVKDRVVVLGPRRDVENLVAAADLMLHPARTETTGTVLLEAVVNGLPVIATAICGFAHHIERANAGVVLPEPFAPDALVEAILASTPERRKVWSDNGIAYGREERLYSGVDVALGAITTAAHPRPLSRKPAAELISVIVVTYNREDALDAVLRALSHQTDRDFEVVIADDGSGSSTADTIEAWKSRIGVRLSHVWQPHHGFRAAAIRNRAILASQGRYCIFLDGDCIPRSDFIATHRELSNPGWFVTGNRVLMSRDLSDQVLRERLQPETWQLSTFIAHWLHGNINRFAPLLRLQLGSLRRLNARRWRAARCANLGVWRADLERVDGLDARFSGWGLEDSDLLIRLLRAGVGRKDGRFATGVLHLWHPESDRSGLAGNQLRLGEVARSSRIRAIYGLSSLAKSDEPAAVGDPVFQDAQAVRG